MLDKIKNSNAIFWLSTVPSISFTAFFTFVNAHEYYVVGIKKDIKGYPFGQEGPVAGLEHYKNADLYAEAALEGVVIFMTILIILLILAIRRKTLALFILNILFVCFIIINLVTNFSELD